MKKKLTEKTVYEPNALIKVAVENIPFEIAGITKYKHKVTITIDAGASKDKLSFSTDEDIAKFVETVDFEDPQTSLPVEGKGK